MVQEWRLDATACDPDPDLVSALPKVPAPGTDASMMLRFWTGVTSERLEELRGFALERAAEEAAGEGVDFTGQPPTRLRVLLERRGGSSRPAITSAGSRRAAALHGKRKLLGAGSVCWTLLYVGAILGGRCRRRTWRSCEPASKRGTRAIGEPVVQRRSASYVPSAVSRACRNASGCSIGGSSAAPSIT